jgi:hypothetical protein
MDDEGATTSAARPIASLQRQAEGCPSENTAGIQLIVAAHDLNIL